MNRRNGWIGVSLAAAVAVAFMAPAARAQTQTAARGDMIPAPVYATGAIGNKVPRGFFNTPESDGRPGVYYFDLGALAARKHDFTHAIEMFKVAASWAYKPAEYDLGLMYFKGEGVPADRPLGAAWMVLAAERRDTKYHDLYVRARDLTITSLSNAEFAQTDKLWGKLKQTYGDKVALRRAKAQWRRAGRMQTGSHLGHGVGDLQIGAVGHRDNAPGTTTTGDTLLGSAAGFAYYGYGEFQQSYDPYDPVFLKNRGKVTVQQLRQINAGAPPPGRKPAAPSSSSQPPDA